MNVDVEIKRGMSFHDSQLRTKFVVVESSDRFVRFARVRQGNLRSMPQIIEGSYASVPRDMFEAMLSVARCFGEINL